MKDRVSSMVQQFSINPKRLFLIDGLGALLTAFLIVAMLMRYIEIFGMPLKPLYFLSGIAFSYAIYSICCYLFIGRHWQAYLKLIAFANLLYCCVTITFVIYFYASITILGFIYFSVELIVISCLAAIELLTASHNSTNQ